MKITTRSPEETRVLGASLAPTLLPGDVISLSGDLGAGKTLLVQSLGAALGVQERITSPSFTLLHEYAGRYPIKHLDVYRLDSFQEVLDLGFEELLDPEAVLVVEWGEAVRPLLPVRYLRVDLHRAATLRDTEREVTFIPYGSDWVRKIRDMRTTAEALFGAVSPEASPEPRFMESVLPAAREHRGDMREGSG
ncbi:MAG: tRNA (adenosine(37)-N6)-threonylcarbamoyltransferase complex ATPase subunit type 1 TsaE [Actinomycetota bacterium]|nr:tRNA (adenosine(37)-N6)-threonylcarbamoyltransferase complex ATPase subunit type 1 TsaE [Actinomycetota bacterium]